MASGTTICVWLVWTCYWTAHAAPQRIFREDRLALLSGTLRTLQGGACDGDMLNLRCPASTSISIQLVQYGRGAAQPDICGQRRPPLTNATHCLDRGALKVVVKKCGGKRQCQLYVSSETFGVDPCPGVGKYVEVLYKCRPTEFRSTVVCHGRNRNIYCGQDRIAIYSASYGTKASGSVLCPQPSGTILTDCQAGFTSEKLISRCQGRPSCELEARDDLYGRGCPDDHDMYLTASYTCVPGSIFTDQYDHEVDEDYQQNMTEAPYDGAEEDDQGALTPAAGMESPNTARQSPADQRNLLLYLTLAISGVLLLSLGAVLGRLCVRYRYRHSDDAPCPPPAALTDIGSDTGSEATGERPPVTRLDLTSSSGGHPSSGLGYHSSFHAPHRRPPTCVATSYRAGSVSPTNVSDETDRYPTVGLTERYAAGLPDHQRYSTLTFGDRSHGPTASFGDNLDLYSPIGGAGYLGADRRLFLGGLKPSTDADDRVAPPHSAVRAPPPTAYFRS